jgi:hypothetical protein
MASMACSYLALALLITIKSSFLKIDLHPSMVGGILSKSHPFLHFHMLHVNMIITSIRKGTFNCCLMMDIDLSSLPVDRVVNEIRF